MAEIEKTPTLGLNKPPKGYFDWDVPLNENWDKLDFLGAGQLPLLTPIMFDHRLEGNEAIGWAMQGSILDGDEYTSVWEKLKTAKDRATQQSLEINEVTYTIFKDATSGWVFLDQANYNKAFTNLKDSLGFILVEADGKKTITLPKREVYSKPSLSDANVFGAESLPNIKGTFEPTSHKNDYPTSGAFYTVGAGNSYSEAAQAGAVFGFDASRSSEIYQDGAKVNPDHHTVFIYYKVGNTIVNQEQIDLGNLTSQVNDLATNKANTDFSNISSNIDYVVESGTNYRRYKSGFLMCWGQSGGAVIFPKPFSDTSYSFTVSGRIRNDTGYTLGNYNFTTTGVSINTQEAFKWLAMGQGAE